jgi:hypothetical protein
LPWTRPPILPKVTKKKFKIKQEHFFLELCPCTEKRHEHGLQFFLKRQNKINSKLNKNILLQVFPSTAKSH